MAMPATPETRRYTVDEVYAWPNDGNRYEVVHGELLVTPAPRAVHQGVVGRLFFRLAEYLKAVGLEHTLFPGPADIFWGDDIWVQPDMLEEAGKAQMHCFPSRIIAGAKPAEFFAAGLTGKQTRGGGHVLVSFCP